MTWDNYLIDQLNNGVYAIELFIKTTAVLIGINIQKSHQSIVHDSIHIT